MIHVLLVNETNLLGDAIADVLDDKPDIAVNALTTSVEEALARAAEVDVALVSTGLPDNGALRLTRALVENTPCVKIVVMGLVESEKQILDYVEADADGYVLRDSSVGELMTRIRAAHEEEALISPRIAAALMRRTSELARLFSRAETGTGEAGELTSRSREVLDLIGKGLTNREIAKRLFIEEGAVKNHVHSILRKLDVSNRQEAAAYLTVVR
jgi:DNA-binding NarL/FixJ family response regulator